MTAGNFLVLPQGSEHPAIAGDPILDDYFAKTFPRHTVVEVAEFSLGMKSSGAVSGPGGPTAGKAVFDRLIVTKAVDKASASLLPLVGTAQVFPWVQLYVIGYAATDKQQMPYVGYEF